jgi:hypothetical protein
VCRLIFSDQSVGFIGHYIICAAGHFSSANSTRRFEIALVQSALLPLPEQSCPNSLGVTIDRDTYHFSWHESCAEIVPRDEPAVDASVALSISM